MLCLQDLLELVDGHHSLTQLCTAEMFPAVFCHGPSEEIRRRRLDTRFRKQHAARPFGNILVLVDHLCYEGYFARHIQIVRAVFCASLESLRTVSVTSLERLCYNT